MSPLHLVRDDQPVTWSTIHARGPDAIAFLHGQLTLDVTSLSSGDHRPGLLLSPAGDVITSLVCALGAEGVELVVRSESVEPTMTALRRFLLRTRCTFDVIEGVTGPYATLGEQVELFAPGPEEFARGLGAHSFGREFVASHVSFAKGCFTGQELVGRLDARGGNVPYRLARLTGSDLDELDALARSRGPQGDRALQGVTTAVASHGVRALAIVHRTLLEGDTGLASSGVSIETLPGAETVRR